MRYLLLIILLIMPINGYAELLVGVNSVDITPRAGVPSAGYEKRKGAGMQGVHDPLLAVAMVVDSGDKQVAFCSVDNLGLPYSLIQKIKKKVISEAPTLSDATFFIGSTHTHSGGGAFMDIPVVGELLAGPYDEKVATMYVDGIAKAIIEASKKLEPASIGIGYKKLEGITQYRAKWPENYTLENDLAVIKVLRADGSPIAVLFNFALHPTVLGPENMLFSSDFVGCARKELAAKLGADVACLYFNGAQAEIIPEPSIKNCFCKCSCIGTTLANAVTEVWNGTKVSEQIDIVTKTYSYSFTPKTTPFGLTVPLESYPTEVSILAFNKKDLFVAVPGELSCIYNTQLKAEAQKLGYSHLSVLGLVNDAHGYILLPEAMHAKTHESGLSFGGEFYGAEVVDKINALMKEKT